jgi:hypothetical protein
VSVDHATHTMPIGGWKVLAMLRYAARAGTLLKL